MNIETKFKIGDFVSLTAQIKNYENTLKPLLSGKEYISMGDLAILESRPPCFQIIERIIQTCPDGTQIHYKLRSLKTDAILSYLELELTQEYNDGGDLASNK